MGKKTKKQTTSAKPVEPADDWQRAGQGKPFNFETKGDTLKGQYIGNFSYTDKFKHARTGYRIRSDSGLKVVFERGDLARKMAEAPMNSIVKIIYKGMIPTKANKMHTFDVLYKVIEDEVPF